jgi:hypothetical protein
MARIYPDVTRPLRRLLAYITRATTRQSEHAIQLGLAFSEETITDLLLLELKRAMGGRLQVHKFSKREESVTGADWVWWLGGRNGWFGMRVQAKRLDHDSLIYEHLGYRAKKKTHRQIDLLISAAAKDGIFPAYCFYNAFKIGTSLPALAWNCGCHTENRQHLGVMLAAAEEVVTRPKFPKCRVTEVSKIGKPLHCIDCDISYQSPTETLAEKARNLAIELRSLHWTFDSAPEEQVPEIVSELPVRYEVLLSRAMGTYRDDISPRDSEHGLRSLAGVAFIMDNPPNGEE